MNRILFYKYEVLQPIGSGRTGKVYLAKDLHLNQLVAVKESTEEFLSVETELLKGLDHPGLPRIYDCFRQQESTFLVMEYVVGMTLRQYLDKHGKVPRRQAVKWAVELCEILGYLHGRHPAVIYRDLKPENIMIRQDGGLKLIDLGSALRCAAGREKEELCVGTPGYCPVEQWNSTRGKAAWDIYGIGAVLHEMLTGVNPTLSPHGRRPLGEYDKTLKGALDEIVRTCTSEHAEDRYQSTEQVKKALLRYPPSKQHFLWQVIKKSILLLAGGYTAACFLLPLLKGIPENAIPFPYLRRPLLFLGITIILYLILHLSKNFKAVNKRTFLRKQEKNIWLTEKKFSGLFSVLLCVMGTAFMIGFSFFLHPVVHAGEEAENLWVEMRDDQGRKMLLKNDAVYITNNKVRFELPADRLPMQRLSMQIVAAGDDGNMYSSRIFYIMREKEEQP